MEQQLFALVPLTKDNLKKHIVIRFPASDGSVHVFNDSAVADTNEDNTTLIRPFAHTETRGIISVDMEVVHVPTCRLLDGKHFLVMEGSKPASV